MDECGHRWEAPVFHWHTCKLDPWHANEGYNWHECECGADEWIGAPE